MKLRERLAEIFSPPDERAHIDRKLQTRERRLERVALEQRRLERLAKMLEVKGGGLGE